MQNPHSKPVHSIVPDVATLSVLVVALAMGCSLLLDKRSVAAPAATASNPCALNSMGDSKSAAALR